MSKPGALALQALIDQANQTTGSSDSTLTAVIQSLIEGYGQGSSGIELWKTVVLDEDHTSPSTGNPVYWRTFFEISEQDILDGYIFLVMTSNNAGYLSKTASWYVGNGFYFADKLADGTPFVNAVFARTPFNSGGSYRADYYAYANAGTIFKIYRFKPDKAELYSVGTELVTRFIGRDSYAKGNFYIGKVNAATGEMWFESDEGYPDTGATYAISKDYIPVDASYSYYRGLGFLYYAFYYDEDKNFISYATPSPNNTSWVAFPPLPSNAKYMRIAIHSSTSYRNTIIVRTA